MDRLSSSRIRAAILTVVVCGIASCAAPGSDVTSRRAERATSAEDNLLQLQLLDRVTWGASLTSARQIAAVGTTRFLEQQLHPLPAELPREIQSQIEAMTITQQSPANLAMSLEQQRRDTDAISDPEKKKAAQLVAQQELNRIAREATTRSLLRALYSSNQLQEQMTWFWMNHFSVHQYKRNIRVLLGDYEEQAIRAHALGHFRDLLSATAHHPAMLRYLDNEQNAVGHINENYARELMELHTMGVNGGYSQQDVQELARILTGVGVNLGANAPTVRPQLQSQYVRNGLFEFNPNRHDYGDKTLLARTVKGRGLAEVDEAIDLLARQPATAHFISRKLAIFFIADEPAPQLVERMASKFLATNGDITATLSEMFGSPEFIRSLGHRFKDPVHYVLSAIRLAYDDKTILNAGPIINWLNRMGEPLYGHATPDGYPLNEAAWSSPGQMATRFEIARAIGYGSAGLFKTDGPQPVERAAFPQLANALYYTSLQNALGPATRKALEQAGSQQEWNMYLLSSPEFMHR